jgi:ferredoxin
MKVSVDDQLCDGHGTCSILDEDFFTLDDNGHSAIGQDKPVPPGLENTAEAGVAACPMNALRVLTD